MLDNKVRSGDTSRKLSFYEEIFQFRKVVFYSVLLQVAIASHVSYLTFSDRKNVTYKLGDPIIIVEISLAILNAVYNVNTGGQVLHRSLIALSAYFFTFTSCTTLSTKPLMIPKSPAEATAMAISESLCLFGTIISTLLYADECKTILENGLTNINKNVLHATLSIATYSPYVAFACTFFFIGCLRLRGLTGLFAMAKTNTLTWLIVIYDNKLSTFNCKAEFMGYDPDKINEAIDKNRVHTIDSKYI